MVLYQIRYSLSSKPWSRAQVFARSGEREGHGTRATSFPLCSSLFAGYKTKRKDFSASPPNFPLPERKADNTNKHILTWLSENILTSFTNTHTAKGFKDIMQYSKTFTSGFHSNKSVFHDVNSSNTMATTTTWREKLGCEKWPAIFTRCNYRNTLLVFFIAKIAAEYKAVFFSLPCQKKGRLTFTSGDDYQQNVFLMLWVCLLFSSL